MDLKSKLARGQASLVVNVDHPSPSLVEYLCWIGVDAVFFDCEQGSPDIESVENMARAAKLGGASSLVRLWSRDAWMIERMMLRGIDGIVVPRVDDVATAKSVVDTVRYVFPRDHQDKTVVLQIESLQAVEELDGMLELEGVDAFFIGPVDLSKSLGHEGRLDPEPVQQLVRETVGKIRRAGKCAGMLVTEENVGEVQQMGATFLYCHANDFLRLGLAAFRQRMAV